jgi:hypothetical protein
MTTLLIAFGLWLAYNSIGEHMTIGEAIELYRLYCAEAQAWGKAASEGRERDMNGH